MNTLEKAKKELDEATEKYNKALEHVRLLEDNKDIALAEVLHTNCRSDCDWHYNSWEIMGDERKRYLVAATILLNFIEKENISIDVLYQILGVLKRI